ncbi:MAG: hypothetical protein EXQ70_07685 [Solirubrobacterales bacterium]|nr:hypothetical protein [Solirubrobacterales bacterium]
MRLRTQQRIAPRGLTGAGAIMLTLALSVGMALATSGSQNNGKHLGKTAAAQCAKERKALGNTAFKELYGKPAMPNCIGVTRPEVGSAEKSAGQDCRAERDEIGVDAFRAKYGSNENGKNAYGKCVSSKAKAELSADREATVNAAKDCKAERDDAAFPDSHGGKSFAEFYSSNKNGKNAYGKCVSSKAKEAEAV